MVKKLHASFFLIRHLVRLNQDFATSAVLTFWMKRFSVGGLSCSIPLDASSTPRCYNPNCLQTLLSVPWGTKLSLAKKP